MRIVSLASGSAGNAYAVESQGELLLVDCGISYRELAKRLAAVGIDIDALAAVVVTHEHIDHTRGLETLHKRHAGVPLYANFMTAEAIECPCRTLRGAFTVFENGMPFRCGPFGISAFSIPHDVSDPVGYMIEADGLAYFHATDIGSPLDSIGVKLSCADVATLESNHDPALLKNSARPEPLKARIRGPRGHLCNDDAAALAARFASPRLRVLALGHLSQECNEPRLAVNAMRCALDEAGRGAVRLCTLSQDVPVEVFAGLPRQTR